MQRLHWILWLLICLLQSFQGFAQKHRNTTPYYIEGKVMQTVSHNRTEPLPYANLALLQLPDSSFVAGCTSTDKGEFSFQATCASSQKYLLKASYIGYATEYTSITFGKKSKVQLEPIVLEEDVKNLKEVVITAISQPAEQKGDTTVYNAEAYKIPEGAYLEELVRRISGLSYNPKDKSITYKGQPIREITVNGKDFFKGNHKVALENLPADFVSRLRVYDKATEEEELTGVKGSEKNYVLDLQTKQEVNGTLMSALEGGYGNKHKFDTRGQVFHFKDNGENIGLVGSFGNKSATTSYRGNRNGNLGGNISKNLTEQLKFSASLNYSHSQMGNESTARNEQYLNEENQYGISETAMNYVQHFASSSANLVWNLNKQTMLHISGNAHINRGKNRSNNHSAKFNKDPLLSLLHPFQGFENTDRASRIHENEQQNQSHSSGEGFNLAASLTHKLNEKGNSLGISFSSQYSNRLEESYKISLSTFYQLKNSVGQDSVYYQNLYQQMPTRNQTQNLHLSYTQKISDKDNLQMGYALLLQKEKQQQDTYDLSPFREQELPGFQLPEGYEVFFLDSLSNQRRSRTTGHRLSLSYTHEGEVWNLHGEIRMTPQTRQLKQEDETLKMDTTAHSIEWGTFASIQYRKGDYDLTLGYNGNTRQPSLQELLAPTVYHSALYVSRSNPNLKAVFQHSVNLSFSNYTKGISAYVVCNQEINGITQASLYDPQTGKVETYPVNINSNWSVNGSANYERRIGSFKLTGRGGGSYNHDVGLMNESGSQDMARSITRSSSVNTFAEISYLPQWGNIDLNGSWDFQQFKNSLNQDHTLTRFYTVGTNVSAQLPLRFQINSDFSYHIRSGSQIKNREENEALWNLKLSWKFTKEQRTEVSLLWADILNQRKSLRRSATANGFYESYTEQLGSYFLISLKYRFNKMNTGLPRT